MSDKLQKKIISLKQNDFKYFFKGSKRLSTQLVNFYLKPNGLAVAPLGIVIKKLHVKTAVKRNKIKRIVREHFRPRMNHFFGYDVVILVNKFQNETLISSFRAEFEKQWLKLEKFSQRYLSN